MKTSSFILTMAAITAAMAAEARTLTPDEALARVYAPGAARKAPASLTLVSTVDAADSTPALYIYSKGAGAGYMLLAADDVAAPVLAYSDSGSFDPEAMPPQMRWWLEEYARQIEAARAADVPQWTPAPRIAREPVAPLLDTTWDQGTPYNNLCPTVNGVATYSGCVATAMAQIMKYYSYPAVGTGSVTYRWESQRRTLSMKFDETPFEWDLMLTSYAGSYTSAQANAVATLMKACGYSVQMDYGTGASGAACTNVSRALISNFRYSKGMVNAFRDTYTTSAWESAIYDNLRNVGPVLYAGSNDGAGHCFVCDGYSTDGYFHFNWGWSGISDGYYLLSALNPDSQGSGGSLSGYNWQQQVTLGITPDPDGTSSVVPSLSGSDPIGVSVSGKTVTITGGFWNWGPDPITGQFGVRVTDEQGQEISILTYGRLQAFDFMTGYKKLVISLSTLANGTYYLHPIFRMEDGTVYEIRNNAFNSGYVKVVKTSGGVTATVPERGALTVSGMKFETPLYEGCRFIVSADATWTGTEGISCTLNGLLLSLNATATAYEPVALGSTYTFDLNPDGTVTPMEYASEWISQTQPAAGDYYFCFARTEANSYVPVSEIVPVKVLPSPGALSLKCTSYTVADRDRVDPAHVQAEVGVECLSGYYFNPIIIFVFPASGGYNVAMFNSTMQTLEAGQSATFRLEGAIPNAAKGERYQLIPYYCTGDYDYAQFPNRNIVVTIGDHTGIGDIEADPDTPALYFDLHGRPAREPLAPGVYIRRQGAETSKIIVK